MRYKKRHFNSIFASFAILFLSFAACGNPQSGNEKHVMCIQKVDSLWGDLQNTKLLFGFKMDEFLERKAYMGENLTKLKFVDGKHLNQENILNVQQYNEIYRIYKGVGQRYKDAVLQAEAIFYEIKGLENEVKKGSYDKEIANFVKEYGEIKKHLTENYERTVEVTSQVRTLEPAFVRLAPIIDKLLETVPANTN